MTAARVFRYGLLVGLQDFSVQWNPATWLGGWALRVVTQGVFFALLGELLGSPETLRFLVVGQAVVVGASNTTWAMGGPSSERFDGTYPLLMVAPSSAFPALVGRTIIWLLSGVASSMIAFVLLFAMFGYSVPWPDVLLVPVLILLTCAGSYCMALFIGGMLTLVPRAGTLLINVLSTGLIAICGVSVPVAFWPVWVEAIANAVPLTHGLAAIRTVLDGNATGDALTEVSYLLILSAAWLLAGMLTLDRLTGRGRADGSIEFVP